MLSNIGASIGKAFIVPTMNIRTPSSSSLSVWMNAGLMSQAVVPSAAMQ